MNNTFTINRGIPGFLGQDMVILKSYIYAKHWLSEDQETGEIVAEGNKYLTLFAMVPASELKEQIEIIHNRPVTHGVFVKIIGSITGIIPTFSRVGLKSYQDHLEALGWKFVQTVPGAKGNDYEAIRKQAYAIFHKLEKGGVDKYRKNWESLRKKIIESLDVVQNEYSIDTFNYILENMRHIEEDT